LLSWATSDCALLLPFVDLRENRIRQHRAGRIERSSSLIKFRLPAPLSRQVKKVHSSSRYQLTILRAIKAIALCKSSDYLLKGMEEAKEFTT
jgi:hypothetical protein